MDENIGYNGAYTGSQIDAAIGAVRDKETTWDGKQDKLTGVQGQVVGFDDEGDAVAMPAPGTGVTTFNSRSGAVVPQAGDYTAEMVGALAAPEGGTDGQMLYKSVDDTVWGDKPVMFVIVTMSSGSTGTADKTIAEIADAVDKGYAVFAVFTTRTTATATLPLIAIDLNHFAMFSSVISEQILAALLLTINVNGEVSFVMQPIVTADAVGKNNGIASLDSTGKVPASQLPDMDYIPTAEKGTALGVAELDSTGRVPSTQLPSYVDDVEEYTSLSAFPPTGEDGKIYVAEDSNLTYRWSGSGYVPLNPTLALGETSQTAYRGDRGKIAYDHSQTIGNPHGTTAADVGAVPTNRTVNGKALSANITLNASDVGAATEADVEGAKPMLRTATLTTSGWSSNSQTVTVSGVVADPDAQLIYVSPANKDSAVAWGEAGVFCSAQGANSLTFVCDSTPSANITVNISIQEAQT